MNENLFQKATLAHSQNNLKEAEDLYLKLLNKNSENHQVHFLLGTLYLQKKLPEKALSHLKKSEHDDKDNPHLLMNLGLAYKQAGDMSLSEVYLKKSLSIDPKNADSLNNLGSLQLSKKNYIDAEFNFRKALEIKPNEGAFLINLSECLFILGVKDEPINLLLKIQRGSDFYQDAQTKLFNIFYETKNYRQCIIIVENLKKLNSTEYCVLAQHNLGIIKFKQRLFDEAIDHFENALKKDKNFGEAKMTLGLCQLSQYQFKSGWDNFLTYQDS
ncbi:MAG: tetratricopeptide repeat protein, partial [Methylophilaceae bacterium]